MNIRTYADVKVYIDTKDIPIKNVVYGLEFPNGKWYIGQTSQPLKDRVAFHCRNAFVNDTKKDRAIRKYMMFKVHILYQGENLNEVEMDYIRNLDTYKKGYNSTEGGEGTIGYNHTEEAKLKISIKASNRVWSEEQKEILANSHKKEIIQLDMDGNFIKEWSSAKDAQKVLDIDSSCITKVCRGKRKQAGGYTWKYKQIN